MAPCYGSALILDKFSQGAAMAALLAALVGGLLFYHNVKRSYAMSARET